MAVGLVTFRQNPANALGAIIKSVQTFNWPTRQRRQLSAIFMRVIGVYQRRVQIEPAAADYIWHQGLSVSPYEPVVLVSRAQYVLSFGGEIGTVRDRMIRVMPRSPTTWLIDAYTRLSLDDRPGALASAKRGAALSGPDGITKRLHKLIEELER